MARAMWKGAIQFGLVTIPVKLYLATESKGISFNMLHKTDLSRIQMKVWCPVEDEPISRSDTVKGFEYAPGEYVVVTDEDLERVPLKTVRSIEIEQFTKAERDDAAVRFVKSAYYLEPDKVGRKAFNLLKSVLDEDGLTAICKVVIKDREALAALDPFGDTMLLTTLHWPDEIRATDELDLGDEKYEFKPAELAMAKQLVSAMTAEFDPSQYKDEYRQALEEVIMAKVEGKETVEIEAPEEGGKLIDLMAALEASVNAAKASREASSDKPVSVSDAKAAKAAKATKSTAAAKAKAAEERTRTRRPPSRHGSARRPDPRPTPRCLAGRDESIPEPALGPDVARSLRRVVELVAKPSDVDTYVVDLVDVFATPDLCQQRSVAEDVARVADEVVEQLVLGRRQIEALAAEPRLLLREVDLEIARLERWRATRRRGHLETPQHGLHAGHQLKVVERLGHVIVGPELKALDLVHRVVAGGQHQHRDVRERPDLAEDLEAVDAGEPDVEQHDVRVLVLDGVQRQPRRSPAPMTSTSRHCSVNPSRTDSTTSGSSSTTRIRISPPPSVRRRERPG